MRLKRKYPNFIMNADKQLKLMKGNWGGIKTSPLNCPTWAILSLNHAGKTKISCCIGSSVGFCKIIIFTNEILRPICEKCGLGCYSILVTQGIKNVVNL